MRTAAVVCLLCILSWSLVLAEEGDGRTVVEGVVAQVQLRGGPSRSATVGFLRVVTDDGDEVTFRVLDRTLVLIQDTQGYLWVGRLEHLRVGWRCSVAHGVEEESLRDLDADNVVAQAPD